jgi:hypothetical protein
MAASAAVRQELAVAMAPGFRYRICFTQTPSPGAAFGSPDGMVENMVGLERRRNH